MYEGKRMATAVTIRKKGEPRSGRIYHGIGCILAQEE